MTAALASRPAPHWFERLETPAASDELLEWFRAQPDLETAWRTCCNPMWLLWVADRLGITSPARLLACDLARKALHLVPANETSPHAAVKTAERFLRGEATEAELRIARGRALTATWDASIGPDSIYLAIRAAADAADVSIVASWWPAHFAACDARDALVAAGADRATVEAELADMVRARVPLAAVVEAFGGAR